jgi:hypothetical protein
MYNYLPVDCNSSIFQGVGDLAVTVTLDDKIIVSSFPHDPKNLKSHLVLDFWIALILPTAESLRVQHPKMLDGLGFSPVLLAGVLRHPVAECCTGPSSSPWWCEAGKSPLSASTALGTSVTPTAEAQRGCEPSQAKGSVSPGWQRGRGGCKVRNTRNT